MVLAVFVVCLLKMRVCVLTLLLLLILFTENVKAVAIAVVDVVGRVSIRSTNHIICSSARNAHSMPLATQFVCRCAARGRHAAGRRRCGESCASSARDHLLIA